MEPSSPPARFAADGRRHDGRRRRRRVGRRRDARQAVADAEARLLLVGATKLGLEVAPRVAERCGAGYAAWVLGVAFDPTTGGTTASCVLYAGVGVAEYRFSTARAVLTIGDACSRPSMTPGRVAHAELGSPARPSPTTVLRHRQGRERPAWSTARLVVDCGHGPGELEDLEQVQSLAALLDAQLACSRPLASDRDWFSDWLGLSGAKIKPELCLTIGISGAVQHLIGIRNARLIAAVNNDEDAAIFSQADIGVVADLHEFLPVLAERQGARASVRPGVQPAEHDLSVDPALDKEV